MRALSIVKLFEKHQSVGVTPLEIIWALTACVKSNEQIDAYFVTIIKNTNVTSRQHITRLKNLTLKGILKISESGRFKELVNYGWILAILTQKEKDLKRR